MQSAVNIKLQPLSISMQPAKVQLGYADADGIYNTVMIHCALLGSVGRFLRCVYRTYWRMVSVLGGSRTGSYFD